MSRVRCDKKRCGEWCEAVSDSLGRVAFVCHACERKRKRLCRDCPASTPNSRCVRCRACSKAHRLALAKATDRARYARRRAAVLAQHRVYRNDPVKREHRRQYMHAYRVEHPRDGFDRAYARTYMAVRRADSTYRTRQNARKRELRALAKQRRQQYQEAA